MNITHRLLLLPTLFSLAHPPLFASSTATGLPEARAGSGYEIQLNAQGGLAPLIWRLVQGELPPGLRLLTSGVLTGEASEARGEPYRFVVEVRDSSDPPQTCSQEYSLIVQAAELRISPPTPLKLTIFQPSKPGQGPSSPRREENRRVMPSSDSAPASGGPYPFILTELHTGDNSITGYLGPGIDRAWVEVFSQKDSRRVLVKETPITTVDLVTGAFEVTLTDFSLEEDQVVRINGVTRVGGARANAVWKVVTVLAKPQPNQPSISFTAREGTTSVSGFAPPGTKTVGIVVMKGGQIAQRALSETVSPSGEFEVTLKNALAAGDKVWASVVNGAGMKALERVSGEGQDVSLVADWGRVHANFAFGVILSKEREDFSKRDPYFNFRLDSNWLRTKTKGANFNVFLNTFFETRLTSIPQLEPQNNGMPNQPGAQQEGNDPPADQTDEFVNSKKAAMVQVGVYLPFHFNNLTSWEHDKKRNALFVAPLAKIGVFTPTDPSDDKEKNLLPFHSIGFRFGHYELGPYSETEQTTPNDRPRMHSYLDITFGKWRNFDPNGRRDWRTAFEGRLKIPATPFQIGFDANIGRGADDLRFLIDTDFNVGDLFRKLLKNGN